MFQSIDDYPVHNSQRGWFARSLYFAMRENPDIYCLTGDLGFGMLDRIKDDFTERFVNCGAAEQSMVGSGIGLALSGKIPFCYSITPFLLGRTFEWLRNYIDHERIQVRLVGSGLNDDYKHDGITHHAFDAKQILKLFPNILTYFPEDKTQIPDIVESMVSINRPSFVCLRR